MFNLIGRALTYRFVWEAYNGTKKRVQEGHPSVNLGFAIAAVLTAPVWIPLAAFMVLGAWYGLEVLAVIF